MTRVRDVILMLAICSVSYAEEQRLTFEDVDFTYELIFDDTRIPVAQMREAAWLSPYTSSGSAPFEMGRSGTRMPDGTYVVDKTMIAPWLEWCANPRPTQCEPYDPEVPDAAFMRNAARNLERGEEQVDRLLHMRLTAVLEPVRAYLLEHLMLSLEMQRHRYDYLKSGDVAPMRKLLCRECECGAPEEMLLTRLQTEADPKLRRKLSWYDWPSRLMECERKTHPPAYPIGAWDKFLQDFGIKELGP